MNSSDFYIVFFLVGAAWVGWKLLSGGKYIRAAKDEHVQTAQTTATQEEKQVRHMRSALSFVKIQHRHLKTENQLKYDLRKAINRLRKSLIIISD